MRRRDFIKVVAGSAAVWPLAVRAQQSDRIRRISVLGFLDKDDPEAKARTAAFQQALAALGWTEGVNVRIDYHWAGGDADRVRKYTTELVALGPDVILAEGGVAVGPLLQATHNIPIVFTNVVDPVGSGYVASMSRPGGNATGFTHFEYRISGKWLELLKDVAPNVSRVAVIRDPSLGSASLPLSRPWRPKPSNCFLSMLSVQPKSSARSVRLHVRRMAD
jgi:putative ABC transport system substrate-binding protein